MSQDLQRQQSRDNASQVKPGRPPTLPDRKREPIAVSQGQLEQAVRIWRRERGLNRRR